jgi:hypothetical protein
MAWAITNGPQLDIGLWRMRKYEVLLLVVAQWHYMTTIPPKDEKPSINGYRDMVQKRIMPIYAV